MSHLHLLRLVGVFTAVAVLDYAVLAWTSSGPGQTPARAAGWSVIVGGLGLVGLHGALDSVSGALVYLGGGAVGSWLYAYLHARRRTKSST